VIVLGLTGSIGMGKSTAAAMLRRMRLSLFDADAEVHGLLASGGAAVGLVEQAFPGARDKTGGIDRRSLGARVFGQPKALRRLEGILHPMVRAAERRFMARARARGEPLVVLDIPLLFETAGTCRCDYVLVVSAPPRLQRDRVIRRAGMTPERLAGILRAQLPDREKRRRADFVVGTALSRAETLRQLQGIVRILRQEQPPHRPRTVRGLRRRRGPRRCARW
jgi:dephospho-CoA kinase